MSMISDPDDIRLFSLAVLIKRIELSITFNCSAALELRSAEKNWGWSGKPRRKAAAVAYLKEVHRELEEARCARLEQGVE
jgi:hypothetical protein